MYPPQFILALSSLGKDSPHLIYCYQSAGHPVDANEPFSVNNCGRERVAVFPQYPQALTEEDLSIVENTEGHTFPVVVLFSDYHYHEIKCLP